ncbi:hypothetical protein AQUCO_00400563v1 [Aquilegia coerulea]|nr:hypothetical protein AQUCO_00400563v1 [Aquilegia coerulea]PIA59747.1 hypothetical protein AQUCO_00400563v1 [Aquilegia coerulea]
MEKLKSLIPSNIKQRIAQSTAEQLPSTCSSLLDFFLSLQIFHTAVEELTDSQRSLCSKNIETALDLKQKGNNCFTSGNYDKALSFYTQALRFAPMNDAYEDEKNLVSILYINRASTLHKMGLLMECVRDCDRAIEISPSYAKAWYRRGKANASLESYKDAVDDLNLAMDKELSICRKSQIQDEIDIIVNEVGKKSSPITKHNEKNPGSLAEPHLMELQCVSTPAKGRGMSSVTDIPQASLILSEEPYAAILSKACRDTHCHFCMNELPKDSVPCASCSIPLYCSWKCQVQAGGMNSRISINNNSGIDRHISSISLASNCENALADSNGNIPEHRHECKGVNWPRVLPSEIVLAGRVIVKSMEQRNFSRTTAPIEALELTHNYVHMPLDVKLELHMYSIVLTYCLHHCSTVEFPLAGDSAAQLVILICQIRVNSMAVVHMKSQESNWSLEHPGKLSPREVSFTSNIEQVKVGQAIYSTASMFNHSCQPNIHAYFQSRTLFIRSTELVTAGYPLELSYGPQVGQWDLRERQQLLEDQYAFKCQCSGCLDLNFSDLAINAFSCPHPGCFGVVVDGSWVNRPYCTLKCPLLIDNVKREDINRVGRRLFEQQDGSFRVDPGRCLNCGSSRDLELSQLQSEKAWSCIKRLQDVLLSKKIPENIFSDAMEAIRLLRSTWHAYNKIIAQAEDSLAEAFCLTGDLQRAMHHCKASVQILEKLYHPKHIVIGNELVKLSSIELSLGDRSNAMDNIIRLCEVFTLYYGSHAPKIFPYLESLQKEASKLDEEGHNLHSNNSSEG